MKDIITPTLQQAEHVTPLGHVQAIVLRPQRERPRVATRCALALGGIGLEGDVHADPASPRHVLLAGAPAYARHGLAPHSLRENLLLDIDTARLASGTLLQIGDTAVLCLSFQCEACGALDVERPGLARVIGNGRGMLARVLRGGPIHVGDPVLRLAATLPPWPDDWRARVARILAAVPEGMVVEYGQFARLAGVQASYCRALPAVAHKLGLAHRSVAKGQHPDLRRWLGDGVFAGVPD
ncbi:MOSC domain-containing protein [Pseudoduganella buxea]|uniref:MOSC domain-containing protein n=1 Tax=Pseudoduganella buxea TaxID=1949069 RepID=A0A6I3STS0_9BURK|nr:MOSC domain-containing protein [Pseudoduganella buxea]MTV52583.1 hypothetical protein [Pseudoduganella buxea]GGB87382.1 hypothetical protein GCM10011572_06780 [Pseudoduganella buxea]